MTSNPYIPNKKVTLQDVADEAGVSKTTASLVLRNNPRITEPTRQRVLSAVESLNYIYNQRAASLRTQRSDTIGLIVSDLSNPFYAELTTGIQMELSNNHIGLLLGITLDNVDTHQHLGTTMLERDVDGLIVVPPAGVEESTMRKLARHIPVVLLTRYIPDLEMDYVGIDNELGGRRAVEHLIDRGHRRIAFIGGHKASSARRDRLSGYTRTLEKHQLPVDPSLCITSSVSRKGGYDAVQKLLQLPDPPTAALCYNDVIAFGVMLGLRTVGVEPGADFAVVGFDDVAEASLWQPTLTTVSTNSQAMGQSVAELLLRRLANPGMSIEKITFPSTLIRRNSTRS